MKTDIAYVQTSVFASATAFFYTLAKFTMHLPRYYPIEHIWKCTEDPGVVSQAWYARQIFAFLAAAIVSLIVYFVLTATGKKNFKPVMIRSLGIAATLIIVICMGCLMFHEFEKCGILKF
jgi:ABC-type Fe3+-siderophore transport system permease subunit